jgi:hypothetical protein
MIQVLKTASCRNAGEGCVHKNQSGRTFPWTLCTGLPFNDTAVPKRDSTIQNTSGMHNVEYDTKV